MQHSRMKMQSKETSPKSISVFVQITLNEGRTTEQKKLLYKNIADGLNKRLGVRPEDVLVNLVEVKKENWSFGNGIAQYVQVLV